MDTREAIHKIIKRRTERGKPTTIEDLESELEKLDAEVATSDPRIRYHSNKLRENEKIKDILPELQKHYWAIKGKEEQVEVDEAQPEDIDGQKVKKSLEKIYSLLDQERCPTWEEVAEIGDIDPEDDIYRKRFLELKQSKDLTELPKERREAKNDKVAQNLLDYVMAVNGIAHRDKVDGILEDAEDYFDRNENLLDRLEIHLNPSEGKPESLTVELTEDLQLLLNRSTLRIDLSKEKVD